MLPSSALVALQLGLAGLLLLTCWPPRTESLLPPAVGLLLTAGAVGVAALAVNRPGNFNVRPEIKPGARLVTTGIYRWLRHPMYSAVLLAAAGAVLFDAQPWRIAAWFGLLGVLAAKLRREERYLLLRFPEYASYRNRTWRLLPWLW